MATPVFCCGFECGVDTAHWTLSGLASFDTSLKRNGARSLRINPSASVAYAQATISGSPNILVIKFYVYFTSFPTTQADVLNVVYVGGNSGVAYFTDNSLRTVKSGTSTGSGVVITTGQWYRVDYRMDISSNPQLQDLQVDGVAATQQSNAVAGSTISTMTFCNTAGSETMDMYIDDVIYSHTLGDYPLGAGKVEHFVPTADGTHNIAGGGDFQRGNTAVDILNATTTAFQLVDDVPLPSGAVDQADCWRGVAPANAATDYVEGLFGPASGISTPVNAPRAVEVILAHHQIATTVGQMVVRLNDNGTTDNVFDTGAAAGVTTYRYARKHYAAGPAGAWVIGGGGNGDFTDLRCRFLAPDANPDQCLDAIMIEAEFAEIASTPNKIIQVKQAVNRAAAY